MLLLWFTLTTAVASPCSEPLNAEEFRGLADRADAALDTDDMVAHAQVFSEIRKRAECIVEPVSAEQWARLLVGFAIVQHALERDWRSPLTAALTAFPAIDHDVGADDIRQFPLPVHDRTHWVPVADDGIFFLDGKQIERVPPGDLEGPHLVQSYAGGTWETIFIDGGPYPSHWLAPVSSTASTTKKRSQAPLIAGVTLLGAGTAAGIGSWAATLGRTEAKPGAVTALKATNVAGWAAAGVGAGLVTVHLVGNTRVSAGPLTIRFSGRL